jgi:hypothetical protein
VTTTGLRAAYDDGRSRGGLGFPACDGRDVNATQQCRVVKQKPLKRGPVRLVGEGWVVVNCPCVLPATDQRNHGRSVGLSPERTVVAISTLGGSMGRLSLCPAPSRLTALARAASQPHEGAPMTVAASWSGSGGQ